MVFVFFATTQSHATLLESSIGPCGYCHAKDSIDVIQQTKETKWFGVFPTEDQIERLASCKRCGKSIKEVHYNLREKVPQTFTTGNNNNNNNSNDHDHDDHDINAVNNNNNNVTAMAAHVNDTTTMPIAEGKQV